MYYYDNEIRLCKYLCRKHKDLFILVMYNDHLEIQQNKKVSD